MRNHLAFELFALSSRPLAAAINGYRRNWNLPVYPQFQQTFSPLAIISQQPPMLDFPYRRLPAHFHYVGPIRSPSNTTVEFPWHRLDGRPLVYASLGTLQNRRLPAFQAIAASCDGLGVQLVLTHARGLTNEQVASLPPGPLVVSYAPQEELLKRATLAITHAGLNTALDALSYGVPMVAVPMAHDQPGVAERVRWSGAGTVVPLPKLTKERLHNAVVEVLQNDSYRRKAGEVQASIRAAGGAPKAADLIEEVIATQSAVVSPQARLRMAERSELRPEGPA